MRTSVDGFVADRDGNSSALYPDIGELRENEVVKQAISSTGAVILGRRSYDMADGDLTGYEFQAAMPGRNGKHSPRGRRSRSRAPPRPDEAAAIAAALERFLWETAPAPQAGAARAAGSRPRCGRASRSRSQLAGGWGLALTRNLRTCPAALRSNRTPGARPHRARVEEGSWPS